MTAERSDVGIVVAVKDGESFLPATIDSIRAQQGVSWSCVIVDDGSTDATSDIADAWSARDGRFVVVHQENRGLPISRNVGFNALPPTRFVAFMDADDLWLPHALRRLVEAGSSPGVIGAHGLGDFIDASGAPMRPGEFREHVRNRFDSVRGLPFADPDAPATTLRHLLTSSTLFPPGLYVVRQDVVARSGLFDARLPLANDWDFLMRATREGPLAFVDDVVLLYRRHESNMGAGSGVRLETALARRKSFYWPPASAEQRRAAVHAWRAAQIFSARHHLDTIRHAEPNRRGAAAKRAIPRIALAAARFGLGRPAPVGSELGVQ